ncbi:MULTISPECIES: (2Fe-2S) ferredoxin domain-containing protein [unclassified Pseudonocardia]|uniref:(2Fe-2S) ferredoxin domain-containing protein n=1 Tax=unclassified Pseudonocardia TaxID=2619320 RepID=UPI0001FFE408|nr:(2Fe-2S) ferredoxin domain-containing protein [Pseudonocardia sp. Ae707_Ps1]OLM18571.1 putative 2Fe-2S ferredoxin CbiW involved in B12 biosynthesis [Pseudonocardia sp. Ae707_Ps1]
MTGRALVLVARPTPAGVDRRSMEGLARAVARQVPDAVHIAYLDQQDPTVPAVLDELARDGVGSVLVIPLAVPADRYLVTWIGRAVAHHLRATATSGPEVRIAPGLTGLVASTVARLAGAEGEPVTASANAFVSPAFSELDVPHRHLFVCRGPRCLVHGAGETHRALSAAAKGTTTQVTPCGCLGPCNLGPLVVDGATWHRAVSPLDADELVSGRCAP